MWRGQLWCCNVFPRFKFYRHPTFVLFGPKNVQAPKTLRFKGKMAIFEARNAVKQGKTPKGQMVPISRVYRGPSKGHLGPDPHLGALEIVFQTHPGLLLHRVVVSFEWVDHKKEIQKQFLNVSSGEMTIS